MKEQAQEFDALVASHYPQLQHLLPLPDLNKSKLLWFLQEDQQGDGVAHNVVRNLEADTCETIIRKHAVAQDIINHLRGR
jgi:hypothetical protein